jgi:hypothetical protein
MTYQNSTFVNHEERPGTILSSRIKSLNDFVREPATFLPEQSSVIAEHTIVCLLDEICWIMQLDSEPLTRHLFHCTGRGVAGLLGYSRFGNVGYDSNATLASVISLYLEPLDLLGILDCTNDIVSVDLPQLQRVARECKTPTEVVFLMGSNPHFVVKQSRDAYVYCYRTTNSGKGWCFFEFLNERLIEVRSPTLLGLRSSISLELREEQQ